MNILFDQTGAQALFFNGAAEYAQTVFLRMLDCVGDYKDVRIFSLYDSRRAFRHPLLSPENLASMAPGVVPVDYKNKSLRDIVAENHIDLLFITCLQAFCDLPLGSLKNLPCKVVAVVHDFLDEEMDNSNMRSFQYLFYDKWKMLRFYVSRTLVSLRTLNFSKRQHIMEEVLGHNDADVVVVSEYSRMSMRYNYPQLKNKTHVFAAPAKTAPELKPVENARLRRLVDGGEQYFLLLSADRPLKNAHRMINAFRQFSHSNGGAYKIVTVGYSESRDDFHISLPFLSSSDLEMAYKHCHALLYPSMFEGFGYPPIEAMKYGKPVLSSNVCSMPEVLGDAPVYFSPIYETDMYRALCEFASTPYEQLQKRCQERFEQISRKQRSDLDKLVKILLNGSLVS